MCCGSCRGKACLGVGVGVGVVVVVVVRVISRRMPLTSCIHEQMHILFYHGQQVSGPAQASRTQARHWPYPQLRIASRLGASAKRPDAPCSDASCRLKLQHLLACRLDGTTAYPTPALLCLVLPMQVILLRIASLFLLPYRLHPSPVARPRSINAAAAVALFSHC